MSKVLIVTNDFPPRSGGIQSFVHALAARLPADGVVVYAPAWEGAAEFDARQPFPVDPASRVADAAGAVGRRAGLCAADRARLRQRAVRRRRAARAARAAAARGGRPAHRRRSPTGTRRAGRRCRAPARCCGGSATRSTSSPTSPSTSGSGWPGRCRPLPPARMVQLAPGVDPAAFRPDPAARRIRDRLGIGPAGRWSSACPGWCRARARTCSSGPGRAVSRGGAGPTRCCCWSATARTGPGWTGSPSSGVAGSVLFTGPVAGTTCPPATTPATIFAMPCRTRRRRPGRRGPRHRLPGSVRDRPAGRRRRLRRRAGRHPGRRDRLRRARPRRRGARRPADRAAGRPGRARPRWATRARRGSSASGRGTWSPSGCSASWPAERDGPGGYRA